MLYSSWHVRLSKIQISPRIKRSLARFRDGRSMGSQGSNVSSNGKTKTDHIGVAPIANNFAHMRNKNSNIQGRSPNVVKVIFYTIRNCS